MEAFFAADVISSNVRALANIMAALDAWLAAASEYANAFATSDAANSISAIYKTNRTGRCPLV